MRIRNINLRIFGNALAIFGYFIILYIHGPLGSLVKLVGFILMMPFVVSSKLWDLLLTLGFFGALDLSNVIRWILALLHIRN